MKLSLRFTSVFLLLMGLFAFVGCGGGNNTVSITFPAGSALAIDSGQNIVITVTASNDGGQGVSWSCSGTACTAANLSAETTTSVTFTATGTGTATITATSIKNSTITKSITVTVTATPSLTGATLAPATEGTAYSQTPVEIGGAGTLTFSVSAGSLPAGLSLNSGTGAITGTPTGPASANAVTFTLKVTDSGNPAVSATAQFSITVNNYAAPTIAPASGALPASTEGTAYSQTFTVTNGHGPYTLSITNGSLPAGITSSSSGAQLIASGTPTGPACAACAFSVQVTDSSNPPQTTANNYTLAVNLPPAPSISTSSLPAGTEGTAYNQTVQATGGLTPYAFSLANGTLLPAGLSMNSTGSITGTPTGPNVTTNFTVQVADHSNPQQTATKGLSITVNLPPAPSLSPSTLPNGNQGTPYSQTLTVSGGLAPFIWSVSSGTPPAGLVLTPNNPTTTATLSGTPITQQSNVQFTILATDSSNPPQSASQTYTVSINAPAPLSITTSSPLTQGAYNAQYNTAISATGGIAPYTFSIDGGGTQLPTGLSLTNSNNQGMISGTPTTAGTFNNILVDLHDSQLPTANTTQKAFSLTVTATSIVITPSTGSLPSGTQNTNYSATISASGGVPPYTFVLDTNSSVLPANLSFSQSNPGQNNNTGVFSGTPTATGTTNNIIVDITDSEQPPVIQKVTYSLSINSADPCAGAGTGSESLLNGQYVWVTEGFDNEATPEPALVGGVLNFNGSGTINAAGTLDQNLNSTHGAQSLAITGGTYKVGTDHRACMDVTTSQGTVHYRASLGNISSGVASTGHIINFDAAGPFTTGTLRKQSSTIPTTLSGNFAFAASAPQNTANCNNTVCGGKFAVGGVTIFSSNGSATGEFDFNTNGQLDGNNTLTSWPASAGGGFTGGSYTITPTTGRGTLTFTPTGSTNPVHMVIYVVSASDALLLDNDDQTTNSLFAGEAVLQTGPFTLASLSGESVLYDTSIQLNGGSPSTSSTMMAQVTTNGLGTLSFNGWQVSGGAIAPESKSGITYSVGSDGRVVLTSGGGGHPPVFYMVSANKAFFLGSSNGIETGLIEPQSSTTAPSGAFAFGTLEIDSITSANDGVAVFSGSPLTVSGTSDNNGSGGSQQPNQTFGPVSVSVDSTGLGSISSGSGACTIGATGATGCQLIFYVISPTRAVLMNLQNGQGQVSSNPTLQIADQ